MKLSWQSIFLLIALLWVSSAFAQQKVSTNVGYAEGSVKDSIDNHLLGAATVSIYRIADSSLVGYQLTNKLGKFNLGTLPVDTPLQIIVSYIGYKYFHKKFIIPPDIKAIDLKTLSLVQGNIELKEVIVNSRIPPVQMNGDTLEFNAAAFKMDKNAVVEDLLRKLPGIIVWGDGKITVNGKMVSKVLVEGKPFFGTDATIATQNLPKDAIDKIQVYSKRDEQKSPLDSVYNVNIKLKKNSKKGLFGKIGAGYGTDSRYAADGMISTFSPSTQISLVGAANNINITPTDINTLMRNSSFKGVGANIEYQPDFSKGGLNKASSGGGSFQHDFIPDASPNKINRLDASYFVTNNDRRINSNSQTTINLRTDSNLKQRSSLLTNSTYTNQSFNANYSIKNKTLEFYATPSLSLNKDHSYFQSANTSEINSAGLQVLQGTSNAVYDQMNNVKNFLFKTGLNNDLREFQIDYIFSVNSNKNKIINQTNFVSIANPAQNTRFDRDYDNNNQNLSNEVNVKYNQIDQLLFGENKVHVFKIGVSNGIKINNMHTNNIVNDLDTITQKRIANTYLTNTSDYNTIDEIAGINLERTFTKNVTNRYNKSVFVRIDAKEQFYNQKSISQKAFQNFENSYARFVPEVSINFNNNQFTNHQINYKLNYTGTSFYPTINQIAPLIDSINVFYQQRGNINLKPYYIDALGFTLRYFSYQSKCFLNSYAIEIKAGNVRDAIVDSTIYDDQGRAVNYSINSKGTKFMTINGNFEKAYKFTDNQLQISGSTAIQITKQQNYVNSTLSPSSSLHSDNSLSLLYTRKDFFVLQIKEAILIYRSKQIGLHNYEFRNSVQSTMLSASLNLLKKITLNSNITYNNNTSSYSAPNTFSIWNANVLYRFLKGNQGEIKLSALDLLHQNKNIVNYGSNNSLTVGNVNVLQQYFMVSVAYFPRKFGKYEKKK